MNNKINVEVTTKEQRDELIKQLQEMEFEEKLPESWEDLKKITGYYIDDESKIKTNTFKEYATMGCNKNIFSSLKEVKSALAYAQLTQLLKAYNGDWKPDWGNNLNKFVITYDAGRLYTEKIWYNFNFLALQTKEKAEHFLKHHKELIKQFYMID